MRPIHQTDRRQRKATGLSWRLPTAPAPHSFGVPRSDPNHGSAVASSMGFRVVTTESLGSARSETGHSACSGATLYPPALRTPLANAEQTGRICPCVVRTNCHCGSINSGLRSMVGGVGPRPLTISCGFGNLIVGSDFRSDLMAAKKITLCESALESANRQPSPNARRWISATESVFQHQLKGIKCVLNRMG